MKLLQTKIFLVFICFLSAWFAVQITFGLQEQKIFFSGIQQGDTAQNASSAPKQYQKILQANLFHGLVYAPETLSQNHYGTFSQNADTSSIPVSSLPVKLTGTIIVSDNAENKVVISNGKEQHIYRVGENVNGWKIAEISREEVIISQNGKKEKLILRAENTIKQADFTYTLSKTELAALFNDISGLLQHVQLIPYNAGNIQGLQILSIQSGTNFDKFHLMPQDILLQLNEMTISSYNDITKLTTAANSNEFTLIVLRNNKKISLKYTLI